MSRIHSTIESHTGYGIEDLDPKQFVNLLNPLSDVTNNYKTPPIYTPHHNLLSSVVWTIDNFFSPEQCMEIIASGENVGFDKIPHGERSRLICFEQNGMIENIIMDNINKSNFVEAFTSADNIWSKPYGFYPSNVQWDPKDIGINKCYRINKYVDSGFSWHRDAQYTMTDLVRSNYTLLVYLNDDFTNGETEFILSDDIVHDGITVQNELEQTFMDKSHRRLTIIPKKGMAVLFPQCLLHRGNTCDGTKYVFRTDLVCKGTQHNVATVDSIIYHKVMSLTSSLFRQAQYMELENDTSDNVTKLYEICLSLRQTPRLITTYPSHLEPLLIAQTLNKKILPNIQYVSRNGSTHVYSYQNVSTIELQLQMIKIASLFTILHLTQSINSIDETLQRLCKMLHIDIYHNEFKNSTNVKVCSTCMNDEDKVDKTINEIVENFGEYNIYEYNDDVEYAIDDAPSWMTYQDTENICTFCTNHLNNVHYWCDHCDTCDHLPKCNHVEEFDKWFCDECFKLVKLQLPLIAETDMVYDFDDNKSEYGDGNEVCKTGDIFKKLFRLQFCANDLKNISEPVIIPPLTTSITTKTCTIDCDSHGCYFGRDGKCDYCGSTPCKYEDIELAINNKVSFNIDDFMLDITIENFDKNKLCGKIEIVAPSTQFNHASCNTYATNTLKCMSEYTTYVSYRMKYTMDNKFIMIECIPYIVQ
jgi:hypothetical protein